MTTFPPRMQSFVRSLRSSVSAWNVHVRPTEPLITQNTVPSREPVNFNSPSGCNALGSGSWSGSFFSIFALMPIEPSPLRTISKSAHPAVRRRPTASAPL